MFLDWFMGLLLGYLMIWEGLDPLPGCLLVYYVVVNFAERKLKGSKYDY